MLAVAFSMSFFACGNKEQAAEAEAPVVEETVVEEEAAVVEDSTVCAGDSAVCDSAAVAEVAPEA